CVVLRNANYRPEFLTKWRLSSRPVSGCRMICFSHEGGILSVRYFRLIHEERFDYDWVWRALLKCATSATHLKSSTFDLRHVGLDCRSCLWRWCHYDLSLGTQDEISASANSCQAKNDKGCDDQ